MKRITLFLFMLSVIGVTGVGCLSEEPTSHKALAEVISNQQTIINKQIDIDKEVSTISGMQFIIGLAEKDRYNEMNTKLDMLLEAYHAGNMATSPSQNTIKIDISVNAGSYGGASSFNSIDDAIKYLETFR